LIRVEFVGDCRLVALFGERSVEIRSVAEFASQGRFDWPRGGRAALSSDGRWLAIAHEHRIELHDLSSNLQPPRPLHVRVRGELKVLAFEPAGTGLLVVDEGGVWERWDTSSGVSLRIPIRTGQPGTRCVQISPDGRLVAFGDQSGSICVYSLRTGQPLTPALRHLDAIVAIDWNTDGSRIAALTEKGLLSVWDLARRASDCVLDAGRGDPVHSVRFSPSGDRLVAVNDRGVMQLWDVAMCKPVGAPLPIPLPLRSVSWSADGSTLCAITGNGRPAWVDGASPLRLSVWDTDSLEMLADLDVSGESSAAPRPVLVQPRVNISQLAAGLSAWDFSRQGIEFNVASDADRELIAISPDRGRIATGAEPGAVVLLSNSGRELRRWSVPADRRPAWMQFHPSGRLLAAAGSHWFRVWDVDSGREVTTGSPIVESQVLVVRFRDDGRSVLLVADADECQVWSTDTWQPIGPPFKLHGRCVLADFVSGGSLLVTVTELGLVRLWDWRHGEPITLASRSHSPVTCADLLLDQRQIVLGGADGSLRLVNLPGNDDDSVDGDDILVSLLSGSRIDQEHGVVFPLSVGDLCELWSQLKSQHAELVEPDEHARQEWHLRQLDEARLEHDFAAQLFHLEFVTGAAADP
jgi:WD40 repeat protein